jgi:hypothetical protein
MTARPIRSTCSSSCAAAGRSSSWKLTFADPDKVRGTGAARTGVGHIRSEADAGTRDRDWAWRNLPEVDTRAIQTVETNLNAQAVLSPHRAGESGPFQLAGSSSRMSAEVHRVSCLRMQDRQLRERSIRQIQDAVAQMFGLSTEELRTESRSRDVGFPRQIAMYVAKSVTDASLSEIGLQFGGKHHTTVMHSVAKIHQLRATDAGVNNAIQNLLEKLTSQSGQG